MDWLSNSIVQGAIAGAIAAASVDLSAFRAWKRWNDILSYDWRVATFRWFQGAVLGALSVTGVGAVLGG